MAPAYTKTARDNDNALPGGRSSEGRSVNDGLAGKNRSCATTAQVPFSAL